MVAKRQAPPHPVIELFQKVLGFKRNAFISPLHRIYTPGAYLLGVPGDLLQYPYVVVAGDSQPTPGNINLLFKQYPIRYVLVHTESQTTVYSGTGGHVFTPEQLKQAFGYCVLDDSARREMLEAWIDQPWPLCGDHDYILHTLQSAYSLLIAAGLSRTQTLHCIGRILLGLAGGASFAANLWRQPERLGEMLFARATAILRDSDTVTLDALTWLRLVYLFAPIDWNQIQWDLLGPLYTQTLSRAKRRGQGIFYTPPELVDQVLDTAGLLDKLPVVGRILEPCAGSGAFVVRLLARVRMAAGESQAKQYVQQLLQQLTAIEPDAEAAWLLQHNVGIQWACACSQQAEPLPQWDLRRCDALLCYSPFVASSGIKQEHLQFNPCEKEKLQDDLGTDFAYVIGNPPYIGESGHKELFAKYRNHPFWREYSESKMDFLQYFFILGLSKIQAHPHGRICFLTSSYWLTADGAQRLREVILVQAIVRRVLYIRSDCSLFEDAPGHHSVITLLERCMDPEMRDSHKVLVQELAPRVQPREHQIQHAAVVQLQEIAHHTYGKPQGSMKHEPWFLQVREHHLDLLRELERGSRLSRYFAAKQGVVPGTQRIGQAELRFLGPTWVAEKHIQDGEGVFVLTSAEVEALNLPTAETRFIRPFVKNSYIQPYAIAADTSLWLVYLRHDQVRAHECPVLMKHLARFRPLLERKREYRMGKRDWFHIHWPREEHIFTGEKIMTAQRGSRPAFVWCEQELFAATDVYFIVPRIEAYGRLSLPVLTGILNSSLGWFWFAHRTKAKGEQREFFSHALEQFPLPVEQAVEAAEGDGICTRLDQLVRRLHRTNITPEQKAAWLREVDALVFALYGISAEGVCHIRTWLE